MHFLIKKKKTYIHKYIRFVCLTSSGMLKICVEAFNRAKVFFSRQGSFDFLLPSEARAGGGWSLRPPEEPSPGARKATCHEGALRSHTKDKNTPFFSWGPTLGAGETYLPHINEKKAHSFGLVLTWLSFEKGHCNFQSFCPPPTHTLIGFDGSCIIMWILLKACCVNLNLDSQLSVNLTLCLVITAA